MATPAIQEQTTPNTAITTAPEEPVADSQPQQHEIPDVFQKALDTPHVSQGFWSSLSDNVGRYSDKYAEIKLKTDYLTQI